MSQSSSRFQDPYFVTSFTLSQDLYYFKCFNLKKPVYVWTYFLHLLCFASAGGAPAVNRILVPGTKSIWSKIPLPVHNMIVGFAFQGKTQTNPNQPEYLFEIVNHEKEGYIPSFAWIEITITLFMIN